MNYTKLIYLNIAAWSLVLFAAFHFTYQTGVEHGRLQGLQCGTDTECEVLEDMLARH